MCFFNELKRFWYINVSKPNKIIVPLVLNIIILSFSFTLIETWVNIDFIFAYLVVWLFFSTNMSLQKELYSDKKSKKFKYYYINSKNTLVNVYYSRYVVYLIKNVLLLFLVIWCLSLLGVCDKKCSFLDLLYLICSFISVFAIFFVLTFIGVVYDRFNSIINFVKVVIFFGMLYNRAVFAPMAGTINVIANSFLDDTGVEKLKLAFLMNFLVYSALGYIVSVIFVDKYKRIIV